MIRSVARCREIDTMPRMPAVTRTRDRTRVRKAVFPAAGLGTRFLPATKAQPKEMLPLVDKPIIQYGVEEAVASGIDNIILVTGRGKNAIEDHFDVSVELETFLESRGKTDQLAEIRGISKLDQRLLRPPGRAARPRPRRARHARRSSATSPSPSILADDVIDADAAGAGADDRRVRRVPGPGAGASSASPGIASAATASSTPSEIRPGVYKIRDLVEKPPRDEAPSNLAIIGRYILTPDIFPISRRPRATAPARSS